jgi:hypothetical protein
MGGSKTTKKTVGEKERIDSAASPAMLPLLPLPATKEMMEPAIIPTMITMAASGM